MSTLLLLEDDHLLGNALQTFLEEQGYECHWLTGSTEVAPIWVQADLAILDRQLPEGDSLGFLPDWLEQKAIPVILLTARTEVDDRIDGLAAGARDYVVKPFNRDELLARIQAQLRPLGSRWVYWGPVRLDPTTRTVEHQGNALPLKPKEFDLLALLMAQVNRVYHRDELLNLIWGMDAFPSARTVDNHILQLRTKLPVLDIETLRGIGYRLRPAS